MDELGFIFLVILITIIVGSNILFYIKLKKTPEKRFKYILTFFIFSLLSIAFIGILYFIFESSIVIDYFETEINDTYADRILKCFIIIILSSITNYYFSKFYLKRISKTKKENEIELIGEE